MWPHRVNANDTDKRTEESAMKPTRIKIALGVTAGMLAVGLTAWAQNIDVKGTTTGEGNAYFYSSVGIGTTTPGYKLDIAGSQTMLRLQATAAGDYPRVLFTAGTGSVAGVFNWDS